MPEVCILLLGHLLPQCDPRLVLHSHVRFQFQLLSLQSLSFQLLFWIAPFPFLSQASSWGNRESLGWEGAAAPWGSWSSPRPPPNFLPSPGNVVSAAAQLGSSCVCTHGPPFPSPPRPGYPAAWPGVLFGPLENLTAAANSPRWVPCPPLTTRHSETLLKIFSCALRLLHLQKLENVLRDLPPWPALKRLLLLLGALRNAIAQNLRFVQGKQLGLICQLLSRSQREIEKWA